MVAYTAYVAVPLVCAAVLLGTLSDNLGRVLEEEAEDKKVAVFLGDYKHRVCAVDFD